MVRVIALRIEMWVRIYRRKTRTDETKRT